MKISMIGLGKLGGPVAEEMAKHHHVTGYDVKFNIKIPGVHVTESKYSAFADKDIIFIASLSCAGPEHIDTNKARKINLVFIISFLTLRKFRKLQEFLETSSLLSRTVVIQIMKST